MISAKARTRRVWGLMVVLFAVLVACVWAFAAHRTKQKTSSDLPPDLTVEALKASAEEPGKLRQSVRDAMRRDDLTDEQRRQVAMNLRNLWQSRLQERVDEYFATPDENKTAVLDQHIDSFMERMKQWDEQRKKDNDQPSDANRQRMRQMFGGRSAQERKEASESRNPDQTARTMAYFAAVRARAQQRGIQMPRGPGRRGGRGSGGRRP